MEYQENVIEWINGDEVATCTLSQKKYVNKAKLLAKRFPNECKIDVENEDGTIVAKIPLEMLLKFRPKRVLTEAQREATRRNFNLIGVSESEKA